MNRHIITSSAIPVFALIVLVACVPQSTPVLFSAESVSFETDCQEFDNVLVKFTPRAHLSELYIAACHVNYISNLPIPEDPADLCQADFTDCPPASDESFPYTPLRRTLLDNGKTVIVAVREASYWRPEGMSISVDGQIREEVIHYIEIHRKIEGESSWPSFFVLYTTGHMRITPHPPKGWQSVCYGSSAIVGPITGHDPQRPIAEIESLEFHSRDDLAIKAHYRAGGSAQFDLRVNRDEASVRVNVDYDTTGPVACFSSMWVNSAENDLSRIGFESVSGEAIVQGPLEFNEGVGTAFRFFRTQPSSHNTTSPDIFIDGR